MTEWSVTVRRADNGCSTTVRVAANTAWQALNEAARQGAFPEVEHNISVRRALG